MKTTIESRLTSLLKSLPNYWENEQLNKAKTIEAIRNYDEHLMKVLLSDDLIRSTYSTEINGTVIFKQQELIDFFRYKDYWDSSYTRFSNEIGLTSEGKYLKYNSDIVLDFPFKDTVLEGGMSKDDVGKNEVFYHNVLAKEEIDVLLSPKVFTNVKKFDKDGEHGIKKLNENDNLIIKGNNLIALHSLKERFVGKIKLIYIDPPYNTGSDSFGYNDRFNHSTWLTFMKNRLEIAKELLSDDGSIWMNIDDDESHYLKVLSDSIFGRENFVANIIWQKKYSPQNDAKYFSDMHDHILVFSKNKSLWKPNGLPRTEEMNRRYKNPDQDERGDWKPGDLLVKTYNADYDYPIETPSGRIVNPPKGRCWRVSKGRLQELIAENRIWYGESENNVPAIKRFLSEVKQSITPQTIWDEEIDDTESIPQNWSYKMASHNQEAKKEVDQLIDGVFSTPKPEKLLSNVLTIGSNENDIVLDFFMGSATTQSVAMKMNRQFIGIEQMDYIHDVSIPRLAQVVQGEQGGISKDVNWQGGGSFVYVELHQSNQFFIDKILKTSTNKSLINIISELQEKAFFSFKVELDKLFNTILISDEISLEEKKRLVLESLDHNQNYVAYSEIDDAFYGVSDLTKIFNHYFYNKETGVLDE